MAQFPKRGDIYICGIDPETGEEGDVPVLIVQNNVGNEFAESVIVALIIAGEKPAFEIEVMLPQKESGFPEDCIIRADRIFTVDKKHLKDRNGSLTTRTLGLLNNSLSISIGLSDI